MRKDWDNYFMDIAYMVATRSTCDKLHVGCVITKDNTIISTGYNGSIHGHEHCDDIGHLINDQGRCIRTIHAEQNALNHADRYKLQGATAYVTHECCENCTKLLVQSGVSRVVFNEPYNHSKHNESFTKDIEWVNLSKDRENKLYIVSGHSGTGKTSLMRKVLKNEIVSVTTRPKRIDEVEGKDYYFISMTEYNKLFSLGEFVEHIEYDGNHYGITKTELNGKLDNGDAYVICTVDGAMQIKNFFSDYPHLCVSILIYSLYEDATEQLLIRGESREFIRRRLSGEKYEREAFINRQDYDYIIRNNYGQFNETKELLKKIILIESGNQ